MIPKNYTPKVDCTLKFNASRKVFFCVTNYKPIPVDNWGFSVDGQSLNKFLKIWCGKNTTEAELQYFSHCLGRVIRTIFYRLQRIQLFYGEAQVTFYKRDDAPLQPFTRHDLWKGEIRELFVKTSEVE